MKTKIEIEIKPFSAPNVVLLRQPIGGGDDAVSTIPLREIDATTLDQLCNDFTDAIFKKAGKERPQPDSPDDEDSAEDNSLEQDSVDEEPAGHDIPEDVAQFPSKPNSKVA